MIFCKRLLLSLWTWKWRDDDTETSFNFIVYFYIAFTQNAPTTPEEEDMQWILEAGRVTHN